MRKRKNFSRRQRAKSSINFQIRKSDVENRITSILCKIKTHELNSITTFLRNDHESSFVTIGRGGNLCHLFTAACHEHSGCSILSWRGSLDGFQGNPLGACRHFCFSAIRAHSRSAFFHTTGATTGCLLLASHLLADGMIPHNSVVPYGNQ